MDIEKIQKITSKGFEKAAQYIGLSITQLRPNSNDMPNIEDKISIQNCIIDNNKYFSCDSTLLWNHKICWAIINTNNIFLGDYLLINYNKKFLNLFLDTYFVARFEPFKPLLIIQTNSTISFFESDISSNNNKLGLRNPEGPVWEKDLCIGKNWAVSMLRIAASGKPSTRLGTDVSNGTWEILMPNIPTLSLKRGTRIRDQNNYSYHISTIENSPFGLRITATSDQV